MTISLIAALARNRVIGLKNRLPWKIPEDMRRFKRMTMGHCLMMGRTTYESIEGGLPGRTIIVLSRNPRYRPAPAEDCVIAAASIEEGIRAAGGETELFVAGGEQIYLQTMPYADRLYLTLIDHEYPGDTFFPKVDWNQWKLVAREDRHDPASGVAFSFEDYVRKTT